MKKLSKKILALLLVFAMLIPTGALTVTTTASGVEQCVILTAIQGGYASRVNVRFKFSVISCSGSATNISMSTGTTMNIPVYDIFGSSDATTTIFGSYFDSFVADESLYTLSVSCDGDLEVTCKLGYAVPSYNNSSAESKIIPAGYNFKEDSFSFGNYSTSIDNEYYSTMFGSGKGFSLWKETRNAGGQCFGMAYATASLYNGLPSCESIRSLKNSGNSFASVSSLIKVNNHSLSIRDFIAYSYIYQFSTNVVDGSVWTNGSVIYNLVKEYTENNRIGVTIGMTRKDETAGHRVLAVGIDGNDILIDDPNNTADYERITVRNDGSWTFSGASGWNSETCYIRYNLDYHMPYKILSTGTTVEVSDGFIDDKTSEKNSFVKDMDVIDEDLLLLSVDCDDYNIDNSNASKIIIDAVDEENTGSKNDLYWIKDSKSVSVTGINGSENEISVSGNNSILEVKTNDSSDVNITMDEENEVSALINTTNGNTYTVSQTSFDINDNALNVSITGTANGDEVVASETEDGIQVTGLNDITVTYETPDGTSETTADVTDGSTVNITVNDDENKVETDWQDKDETETDEECKHSDSNHDGICDACSEDFTKGCSCNCHGNAFMQFLHKIVTFLRKLFGMTQYQYCNCGKAHW